MKSAPSLLIRPALASDAASVAAVYAPYVRDTAVSFEAEAPSAETMAQRIADTVPTHPWLVAERGGGVVGYAYAGRHSQRPGYRWTVDATVYVEGGERRRGVGRVLYRALLAVLRLQGFRSVFSEIVLPNPGSVRLHERMGFVPVGIHEDVGFKLGHWRAIGYWALRLGDGPAPPHEPTPFAALAGTAGLADALAEPDGEERA